MVSATGGRRDANSERCDIVMTNRHEKRAAKSASETPAYKPWRNISGTDQNCGNCRFSADTDACRENVARIAARDIPKGIAGPAPLPLDETYCLHDPVERGKKIWGWCGKWEKGRE